MKENIEKLKKIELHLHLDGSVPLYKALEITNLPLDKLESMMIADNSKSLHDYLKKFQLPLSFLQTKKNIYEVAKSLGKELEHDNVIYAEIRFCPLFHTKNGLTPEEVIDSVLEGLSSFPKIKTNLILCMMREFEPRQNIKILEVAAKYLGKGVGGVDLAGDEGKYSLKEYAYLFQMANDMNIPYTIHAGEVDYTDLYDAISLGTKRIGHGVCCIQKPELMQFIRDKNILLEVCPTSNIDTNVFSSYSKHPAYFLYHANIPILINTDNRTVSNTNLNYEYEILAKEFPFTISDFRKMNRDAIAYTFLSDTKKQELLEELDKQS